MRVTFVLPFSNWTGGVRVACEYARRLPARGHVARIVFPCLPYRFRASPSTLAGLRVWLGEIRHNLLSGGRPLRGPASAHLERVPWIGDRFLPDADAVVATAWPTAYSVSRLSPRKGRRIYLVQHREIDSGPAYRVDATYRLPLFRIAGSHFTAGALRRELGVEVEAVVPNAVDADFWGAPLDPPPPRTGVLMPGLGGARKGLADGLAALEQVHAARPHAPIRVFGPRREPGLPAFVEYVEAPGDERLRSLYAGAGVFLYPSRYEGFGLPPLEAMAAGCAVVSTRVGAVPDCSIPDVTAMLVEPQEIGEMARAVIDLLDDEARREAMGRAARQHVRQFDWERATDRFEAALQRACGARIGGGGTGGP